MVQLQHTHTRTRKQCSQALWLAWPDSDRSFTFPRFQKWSRLPWKKIPWNILTLDTLSEYCVSYPDSPVSPLASFCFIFITHPCTHVHTHTHLHGGLTDCFDGSLHLELRIKFTLHAGILIRAARWITCKTWLIIHSVV